VAVAQIPGGPTVSKSTGRDLETSSKHLKLNSTTTRPSRDESPHLPFKVQQIKVSLPPSIFWKRVRIGETEKGKRKTPTCQSLNAALTSETEAFASTCKSQFRPLTNERPYRCAKPMPNNDQPDLPKGSECDTLERYYLGIVSHGPWHGFDVLTFGCGCDCGSPYDFILSFPFLSILQKFPQLLLHRSYRSLLSRASQSYITTPGSLSP